MLKTLLITLEFPPQSGGIGNYLANICANLPNDKIVVLTNIENYSHDFDHRVTYKIVRENLYYKKFWPRWLKTYWMANKIIKEQGIEQIMISHILPMGYLALLLKLPFIVSLHGFDILAGQNSGWKHYWLKRILNKAKAIIVNSQFTKDKVLKEKIASAKISLVYPCPNIGPLNLNEAEKQILIKELDLEDKKILLSVGRLVARKGVDKVIEALPEVIKAFPNLTYLIVGKGHYKNKLEDLAQKLGVLNHLSILEDIPDTKLPYFYDLTDIFIMPSRQIGNDDVEGFGIVYLEANAFAKPVIAGNSGGAVEAVINNQTGLLVNPESVQDISVAIIKLLRDKELANKLGIQGKERVFKDFQWPKQIEKIKHLL